MIKEQQIQRARNAMVKAEENICENKVSMNNMREIYNSTVVCVGYSHDLSKQAFGVLKAGEKFITLTDKRASSEELTVARKDFIDKLIFLLEGLRQYQEEVA